MGPVILSMPILHPRLVQVATHNGGHLTDVFHDAAIAEQQGSITEPFDRRHVVTYKQNSPALPDTSVILPRHFFWNCQSPTASTSSTSRISGSRWAATAKARRTYIPLEYRFTGVSRNCSTSENATISSNFLSISAWSSPGLRR